MQPSRPLLDKVLGVGAEHAVVQGDVVDGANPKKLGARERRALAIHERPARLAKAVGHAPSRRRRFVLAKCREVILTPGEARVRVERGEVGREHARSDLAAVDAVAHKYLLEAGGLKRLPESARPAGATHHNELNLPAEARRRRFVLGGPPVVAQAIVGKPGVCSVAVGMGHGGM
ncbi:hypothetical protein EHS25_005526 [Saitozyma podzolica]|uniref:Uncharacterized protein n=1 Tax=Saitozyma podzolica TaxID=1890683 RepID=A0A427XXT1_9TREE|nr:hypothetical protein EHS25_005526 [Saitozyma podzolica]